MIIKDKQPILIPVDFSIQSYHAVKAIYNLARYTKSSLVLAQFLPLQGGTERKDDLEALAASTRAETGFEVNTRIERGEMIYDSINKVAEEIEASIIVMVVDDHASFKTGIFGPKNTFSKFLINSFCHVLTLRSMELRDGCKNLIMPFDLTPESREKVSYAVQLAHLYKADIKIVSIFAPDDEEYENKLFPYLQQVKKFIKNEGVHCTNRTLPSKTPAEAIVEYSVKSEGDLIIQINPKHLSLREKMKGTIAHKIVELSPVPVLNVNPMKRESMSHFSSGM